MGTLALHPQLPFPPSHQWVSGLVWSLWDTRVLSSLLPQVPPAWGLGSHPRPGQGPRPQAGMRAAVGGGEGRTGVGFSFFPLAGFYESFR